MDKMQFDKDYPKIKLSDTISSDTSEDSEEEECTIMSGSQNCVDCNNSCNAKAKQSKFKLCATQFEATTVEKTAGILSSRTSRRKGQPMRNILVTPLNSYQSETGGKSSHQHKRHVQPIESRNDKVSVKSEQCDISFPSSNTPQTNACFSDECSLECDICGQVFKNKVALLKHKKSHTNDYECEYCGQECVSSAMLTKHIKLCNKAKECIKDVTIVVPRQNLNSSMMLRRSSRNVSKQQDPGKQSNVKRQPANKSELKGNNLKANTLKGNRGRPTQLHEELSSEKKNKSAQKNASSGRTSNKMTRGIFKHLDQKNAIAGKKVQTMLKTKSGKDITTEGQCSQVLTSVDPLKMSAIKFANLRKKAVHDNTSRSEGAQHGLATHKLNKVNTEDVWTLKTPVTKRKLQLVKCSRNNHQMLAGSSKPGEIRAVNFKKGFNVDDSVMLERQGPSRMFFTLSSLLVNMNKLTSGKRDTGKLKGSKCSVVDPSPKDLQDDGIDSPENNDKSNVVDDSGDDGSNDSDHGRHNDVKEIASEINKEGQKKEGVKSGNGVSTGRLLAHARRRRKTSFPKGRQYCNICRRDFLNLQAHQKIHTMARNHRCKKCGMSFIHYRSLQRHMTTHMNKYKCGVCSEQFTQKRLAKRHAKVHLADKPYCCEVCNRGFRCRKDLRKHVEIHTGIKKYMCDICGKRCRLRSTFLNHQRVHTGEKPYVCEICGKSFAYSSGLRVHKFSHTSGKPYRCVECGESFPHNYLLKRHRAVHGDYDEANVIHDGASNETESSQVRHVPSHPEVLKEQQGQTNACPLSQDTGAKEEINFSDGLSMTKDDTPSSSLFQQPMQYPPPFAPSYMPPQPPVHVHRHTPSISGTVPHRQMLPNVPVMPQAPQTNAPAPIHVPGAPHTMLHQHTIQSLHQSPLQTEQVSHVAPLQQTQVSSIHHQSRMTPHFPSLPDMVGGRDDQFSRHPDISLLRSVLGPDMLKQNLGHLGVKRPSMVDPIVVAIPVSAYKPQEHTCNSNPTNG